MTMNMKLCKKCEKDRPIVNKKHWLCEECNYRRLHNGVSRAQVYQERVKERVESKQPKITRIKYQATKEASLKKQLSEVKSLIEKKAIDQGVYYCWGCGQSGVVLDKSHILSVKQRKDLELDEANINLFCRNCHNSWESNSIEKMIVLESFENDLLYIREKDSKRYNSILLMIEEYGESMFDLIIEDRMDPKVKTLVEYFMKNYSYINL